MSAVLYQYKPCGPDLCHCVTVHTVWYTCNKRLCHDIPWRRLGERYSSYSFWTSALDGGEWSASRPVGRTLGTHWQEAGWAPEPLWTQRLQEKYFAYVGDRTSIALSSDTILPELHGSRYICNTDINNCLWWRRWNCTQGKSQEFSCHVVNSIWWEFYSFVKRRYNLRSSYVSALPCSAFIQ
jgi:hypothetical protein